MSRWVNRRLVGVLSLLGMALLIIGLFLPWIINFDDYRSLFQQVIGDPPRLSSVSWWLGVAVDLGPLLLVLLFQVAIVRTGLRGQATRALCALGVIWVLVVLGLYLFIARVIYCLYYCARPFTAPGLRSLAPGFWLLLGGFLLSLGSDLAFFLLVGRRSGSV